MGQLESILVGGMLRWLGDEEGRSLDSSFPMPQDPGEARKQIGRSYAGYLKLMGVLPPGPDNEIVYPPYLVGTETILPPRDALEKR